MSRETTRAPIYRFDDDNSSNHMPHYVMQQRKKIGDFSLDRHQRAYFFSHFNGHLCDFHSTAPTFGDV